MATGLRSLSLPAERLSSAARTALAVVPEGALEHAVFRTMCGTDACLQRFAWLGDGLAAAVWKRDTDEHDTVYSQPGHHTLSCYLAGGYRIERNGLPGRYGAPRRLCSLPDAHESRWRVRDSLQVLHVYFMPEQFTRRAVIELDREPRELQLQDRTWFESPELAAVCLSLLDAPWLGADQLLRANEIVHDALSVLLREQAAVRPQLALKGGLAPFLRRRLADWIEAHLHEPITLGRLAEVACLSEFHLARMFRLSFGMPPAAWIAARRVDRARVLLRGGTLPLQRIAAECGYADVSHFAHRFKDAAGVPPGRYREALA